METAILSPIAIIGATLKAAFSQPAKVTGGTPGAGSIGDPLGGLDKVADESKRFANTKSGEAGVGENTIPEPDKPVVVPADQKSSRPVDEFVENFRKKFALTPDVADDYSFQFAVLNGTQLNEFCASNKISVETLFSALSKLDIYIKNDRNGFYEGQEKVVRKADKIESIFAVSKYYAYYWDGKSLWIYSQKKGLFSDEFSTVAKITFTDIRDARMTGLILIAFAKFASAEGLSRNQIADEMGFLEMNFGNAWTDEKGAIVDDLFNRSQFRLGDGRVGVFTVTGQIDPKTNKGYNWATVRGGNTYAGLGGDMVDIKSLLTRAEYRDLALAILNNKSLMVEMIVRVTGSWLLQRGQLNGVAEDIKKFLDYDTSQAPNGYDFDIVNGQVVVTPIGGQRRSQTRPTGHSSGNAEPFFAFYNLSVAKQIQLLPNTKIFSAENRPYCRLVARQGQVDDENEEVLMHIRQLSVPDPAKREKDIYWLVISWKRAMSKLYEALGDPNPLVRLGVLEVFNDMREEETLPTLLKFFRKEKNPKVKIAYVKCLTKLGIQELAVVEEFIRILKKEKNENVLAEIITGLRQTAGQKKPRFTPPPQDNSEELRTMAGKALLKKLRDPNTTEFVKLYLVRVLGELKEIRALFDLADLVDPMEPGTGPLQLEVMKALKMIGSQEAVHILINCLDHPRREISEAAGPLLSSLNTVSLDALISKLMDTSKNRVVRAGCADAIGEMNDFGKSSIEKGKNIEKAYEALAAAQNDADPYVADKATKALERLKRNGFKRDLNQLIF